MGKSSKTDVNVLNTSLACVYLIQCDVFETYKMKTVLPFTEAYVVRTNYLNCTAFKIKRQMQSLKIVQPTIEICMYGKLVE